MPKSVLGKTSWRIGSIIMYYLYARIEVRHGDSYTLFYTGKGGTRSMAGCMLFDNMQDALRIGHVIGYTVGKV